MVVIHGIPDTPVDVYVNDDLTLEDFAPGTVTDPIELPAGTYTLDLRAPDADPASDPLLTADATVEGGASYSVVAHLTADGAPTITPFVNDTTHDQRRRGWHRGAPHGRGAGGRRVRRRDQGHLVAREP